MESIRGFVRELNFAGVGWIKRPKGTIDCQAVVDPVMKVRSFLKGVKFNRVLKSNIYPFGWLVALSLTAIRLPVTT